MSVRLVSVLCGVVVFSACADPVEEESRPWLPPDVPGAFDVGRTTLYFEDSRGKSLVADVWYPAAVVEGERLSVYQPTQYTGLSYQDAAVDLTYGPHPLVAFSHGYISIRFQSFYLMEHLASHGFVVVAPDHNFNTLFDLNPEMDVPMMLERPDDVRFTVDHILALADQPGRFQGALRGGHYAALGHSFGAVTTMQLGGGVVDWSGLTAHCAAGGGNGRVCEVLSEVSGYALESYGTTDSRVQTTVPMSPGLWYAFGQDGQGLESMADPFVLAGALDDVLDWEQEGRPAWEAMSGPKRLALFEDVGHYGFSFLCDALPDFRPECAGVVDGWADLPWVHRRSETLVMAHLGAAMYEDERYLPWLMPQDSELWEGVSIESVP